MYIENKKIILPPLIEKKKSDRYFISGPGLELEITERQNVYFQYIKVGMTIEQLIGACLVKKQYVSFIELYNLLSSFVNAGWIVAPEFLVYFKSIPLERVSKVRMTPKTKDDVNKQIVKSLRFFSNFSPTLQKTFLNGVMYNSMPAKTIICEEGEDSRDLIAILEGTVGIYKKNSEGKSQLVSTLGKGAVFGEGGFFLNKPRSADVIALEPTQVAIIPYRDELTKAINSESGEALQQRFWVLQGLLSSELFSSLPNDCLDALVFSGKTIQVPAHTIITKEAEFERTFYILIQGSVTVKQQNNEILTLGRGAMFGEMALMLTSGRRTATVEAQRPCVLLEIDSAEFFQILSMNLLLAKEIEQIAQKRWKVYGPKYSE